MVKYRHKVARDHLDEGGFPSLVALQKSNFREFGGKPNIKGKGAQMGRVKEMLLAQEEKYEQLTIFDFLDEEEDEEELDDWEAFKREEELSEQNDEDDDDYELSQEDLDCIEYLCEKED